MNAAGRPEPWQAVARRLLASGLLEDGSDIAEKPMAFNTILNWDSLNTGRKLDVR